MEVITCACVCVWGAGPTPLATAHGQQSGRGDNLIKLINQLAMRRARECDTNYPFNVSHDIMRSFSLDKEYLVIMKKIFISRRGMGHYH